MRLRFVLTVILLLLLTASMQVLAQSSDCAGRAAQAQLSSIDPVYVDAMDLARNLIDHGFIVKCVQASKWGNLFAGQEGAASYRTDKDSFDVLFLPKAATFDAIQVVEQRQGNYLYIYSFRGIPPSTERVMGLKAYFVGSANLLFLVWSDADLAASIQATVGPKPKPVRFLPRHQASVNDFHPTIAISDRASSRFLLVW
jgi:hypothetical protein